MMQTRSPSHDGTQLAASHNVYSTAGAPKPLTYEQIADLFHQYREELTRRLIGMVKSRETAADLVQDAYVRLLRVGDRQAVEQPRALLHRIAANLAIDHLRKEKNGVQAIDSLDAALTVPCQTPSPERELLGKQRFRIVLQAIERLPSRTREAFLLCRVYGYSYQEIATRMNISESAVEKLLMRALDRSCKALEALNQAE